MDFRDWTKVKEDKDTCTLRHPKGHTMVIAIKALPKIHQEQIKRLKFAKGGEAPVSMPDPQKAREAWQGAQNGQSLSAGWQNMKSELGFGGGGSSSPPADTTEPKHYAGGTPDHPVTADEYIGDDSSNDQAPDPAQPNGNHTPITINVGTPPPQQAAPAPTPPPGTAPMKAPVSTMFRGPIDQPPAYKVNAPEPAPDLLSSDQTPNTSNIMKNQQDAIQQRAEVEKAQARATAQSTTNNLMNQQQLAEQQAQNFNEIHQATDAFKEYVNKNPINPKSYQENQNSGQKTATAIGLVLGGLGQGFWGGKGSNPAMDFLNKQIDRDIDAQKSRTEQQKTVYGYYHNLYGDSVVATNLARISMNDMYTQELALQAARSGDQMAAIRAKEAANDFAIKNNQLFVDTAGRLGTLRMGGGNGKSGMAPNQQQAPSNGGSMTEPKKPTGNPVYKILTPDAEQKVMGVKYGPLKGKEDDVQKQYQQAIQAEKLLNGPKNDGVGGINDLLKQMHSAAKKSGVYGHLHRTVGDTLGNIPLIGDAGQALAGAIPATESENAFNNAQVQIETDMATALNGIMTPTEIHKLVQKVSPTAADSDESVKNKEKTLVNSIQKAVRGGYLGQAKMLTKGER